MKYLLDTNVVSEMIKPEPEKNVIGWFRHVSREDLAISAFTVAEIWNGVKLMHHGARRNAVEQWAHGLARRYPVLPFGAGEAYKWGDIMAEGRQKGRPVGEMDAVLAATAMNARLTLVTRNVAHFQEVAGLVIANPWTTTI